LNVWTALAISLKVSAVATAVVAVVGGLLGRHLARRRYPGKELLDAITSLPLFLPPTVLGYYLTLLVGRGGVLGEPLSALGIEFTFTWLGAALASAVVSFPLMVRSSRIAFESIERELEDHASLDGANRWQSLLHVALPLARNGLAGGIALAFARAIGEFGATLMLSGNIPGRTQTMPLAIYDAFTTGDDRAAMTMALILTVASLVIVAVGLRLGAKGRG
jgi:molybdate transport system permease protein